MLEEISVRQQKLGLSTRKFAEQLDVSPTLLSLVLNKKRAISGICQDSAHYLKLVPNSAVHSGAFVLGVPVLDAISTA